MVVRLIPHLLRANSIAEAMRRLDGESLIHLTLSIEKIGTLFDFDKESCINREGI